MTCGLAVFADAVGPASATTTQPQPTTAIQIWTLVVAAIAAFAAIVAPTIGAIVTSRAQRGAWLRELQIRAGQEFHSDLEDLLAFVSGAVNVALQTGQGNSLAQMSSTDLDVLLRSLVNTYQRLLHVGQKKTVDVADAIQTHIRVYARLAVPLPGAINRASRDQRTVALEAISGAMVHLLFAMRQEAGLISWRQRKQRQEVRKTRKAWLTRYEEEAKSQVDRGGSLPNLVELLRTWQVMPLRSNELPADIRGYEVDSAQLGLGQWYLHGTEHVEMWVPSDMEVQAVAVKPGVEPWRFGITRGLPVRVQGKIYRDAVRLITGHARAFQTVENPLSQTFEGDYAWIWSGVDET